MACCYFCTPQNSVLVSVCACAVGKPHLEIITSTVNRLAIVHYYEQSYPVKLLNFTFGFT